jgi:hypothetical protein
LQTNTIPPTDSSHSGSPFKLLRRETGAQRLHLPVDEIVSRSMRAPGVIEELADAFHLKRWKLHFDSQREVFIRLS